MDGKNYYLWAKHYDHDHNTELLSKKELSFNRGKFTSAVLRVYEFQLIDGDHKC